MLTTVSFFRWPQFVSAIGLLLVFILLSPASVAGQPDWAAVEQEAGPAAEPLYPDRHHESAGQ